jgi:hypothetical protein
MKLEATSMLDVERIRLGILLAMRRKHVVLGSGFLIGASTTSHACILFLYARRRRLATALKFSSGYDPVCLNYPSLLEHAPTSFNLQRLQRRADLGPLGKMLTSVRQNTLFDSVSGFFKYISIIARVCSMHETLLSILGRSSMPGTNLGMYG